MADDRVGKVNLGRFNMGTKLVDPSTGIATTVFIRWLNDSLTALQTASNGLDASEGDIEAALAQIGVIVQSQAEQAATAANNNVVQSYVSPSSILTTATAASATTSSITIASHTRVLGDGTQIPITGATLSGLNPNTGYYVVYQDPNHTGGAVTFTTVTDPSLAGQTGSQFLVGGITTPASSTTAGSGTGDGTYPPGVNGRVGSTRVSQA